MFKRLTRLLGCVTLLILVACGEESKPIVEPGSDPIVAETIEFEFSIELISDDELANLETYNGVNYTLARHTVITEGLNLRFTFNQPVRNFSLIEIVALENGSFAKTGVLYEVGNLNPETPLVVTDYFGVETLPTSGFYFTGPNGEDEWFTLQQSQMDGSIVWNSFEWSYDDELYVIDENSTNESNVEVDIHIVQAGQTLFSISQMYDTTLKVLQQLNGLGRSTDIQAGQHLNVPQREGVSQNVNQEITFTFELLEDTETLQDFIEFDYAVARSRSDVHSGLNILVRTHNHLTDFQVVAIDMDVNGGLVVMETLHNVGSFTPTEQLLIRSYFEDGSFPRSGFSFIDEQGTKRYFALQPDQVHGNDILGWEINN